MLKRKNREKTEKELAAHFQEHRGNVSTWSKQASHAEVRKKPAIVFSVRFSADELKNVRKQADLRGVTISTYVRDAVLEHATPAQNICIVWKASPDVAAIIGYSNPTGFLGGVRPKCTFGILAGGTIVDKDHARAIIDSYDTLAAPVASDAPLLLTDRSRRAEYAH